MKIINAKNSKIIAEEIVVAKNFFSRIKGLLGQKVMERPLLIEPCRSIHSVGMKFKFDAVFLNKNNEVVYLIEEMKPVRFSPIVFESKKVLELPVETIKNNCIQKGDIIEFRE
ncbi:MAG: DUF192 domain-containing protein [Candidatus Gastranaerophilales bacterium]|nr:DUF192 domain-containing protein [Candidatus Gastranaerophilales bacterium]